MAISKSAHRAVWLIWVISGAVGPAGAQQTTTSAQAPAPCPERIGIPGASGAADVTPPRCALDRAPRLITTDLGLAQPRWSTETRGDLTIVVNADGSVDHELTRAWTLGGEFALHRESFDEALVAIGRWRFEPGMLNGEAVRSGYLLRIQSDSRVDTLASRMSWRYETHPMEDTLRGSWEIVSSPPPPDEGRQDRVYQAALRQLVEMRVILPNADANYCLMVEDPDPTRHARAARPAERAIYGAGTMPRLAASACVPDQDTYRLTYPRIHETENGRAVLTIEGDHLERWPPGFEGRRFAAWSARCVVMIGSLPSDDRARCEPWPVYDGSTWGEPIDGNPLTTPPSDATSTRLAVVVRTEGAFGRDTLFATVPAIPRLSQNGVLDSSRTWCGGRSSWVATTEEGAAGSYIVKAELGPEPRFDRAAVTEVQIGYDVSDFGGLRCLPDEERNQRTIAAFFLGGVGEPPEAPVTLCMEEAACARRYDLDPDEHTLATVPHLAFDVGELSARASRGGDVAFRVYVDRPLEGLRPLVVIEHRGRFSAWFARTITEREFEYHVNTSPDPDADTRYRIYLAIVR